MRLKIDFDRLICRSVLDRADRRLLRVPEAGLDAGIYGLLMVLFMLFEPHGLYGRWQKIKLYLDIFPFYRKATFRRQRVFQKSEQLR